MLTHVLTHVLTACTHVLTQVWASLYSRRAVLSRRAAGVPQRDATMSVLIQQLVVPEYSFIAHTSNPYDPSSNSMVVEAAPGLGELLASGTTGSPYRLQIDKASGVVKMTSFANFSTCMRTDGKGAVVTPPVDYSSLELSTSKDQRAALGRTLLAALLPLERHYKVAQDVEGGVTADGTMYIFQSRPQPM